MSAYTFTLDGTPVRARPLPQPSMQIAVDWQDLGDGDCAPIPRPAAGDIHESKMVLFGTRDEVQAIDAQLAADPAVYALTSVATDLFCPLIDHAATLTATCKRDKSAQGAYVLGAGGYYEMPVTLRAVTYSYIATEGSLDGLVQRHRFQTGTEDAALHRFSLDNVPDVADPADGKGYFDEEFYQDRPSTRAVLRRAIDLRGRSFAFPILAGVDYPFGANGPAIADARARFIEVRLRRANLHFWLIAPVLRRALR